MSAFRDRKKSRTKLGQAVTVYDGRNWPVVKCGAVYLSDEDKTKHVTKKIIQQASSSDDKKKKSSKYTLAIGSSFGHVHAFLNDSDYVLGALETTQAEDKCLMLIRKPKSASKQMLKAHSWANLHEPDDERAFRGHNSNRPRTKGKPHQRELTLLPDGSTATRWQQLPIILPSTELSAVSETEDETRSEVLPRETEINSDTFSNSLPFDHNRKHLMTAREKSKSICDIDFRNYEINNNRPGIGNVRPRGPPPEVPTKKSHSERPSAQPQTQSDKLDDKNNNRTVNLKSTAPCDNKKSTVGVETKGPQKRNKSESGFHGDLLIQSDQFYENGVSHTQRGRRDSTELRTGNVQKLSDIQKGNTVSKVTGLTPSSDKSRRPRGDNQRTGLDYCQPPVAPKPKMLESQSNAFRNSHGTLNSNIHNVQQSNINGELDENYNRKNGMKPRSEFRSSASIHEIDQRPKGHHSHHLQYNSTHESSKSFKEPSSHGNHLSQVRQDRDKNVLNENDEAVARSKSLGDLSAGLAISVVGQCRPENFQNIPRNDLSGKEHAQSHENSQRQRKVLDNTSGMAYNTEERFDHKLSMVRQPQHKHDSLPVRMRKSTPSESVDQIAKRFANMPVNGNSSEKPMQYSSLQHLASNPEVYHRQLASTRNREKTPAKPRRTLPQVPGDVDERKRHFGDLVKLRVSLSSRGSGSSGSRTSNQTGSNELSRQGIPCETPSDREVSELLEGQPCEEKWQEFFENKENIIHESSHPDISLPPDGLYELPSMALSIRSSDSFGSQDHNLSLFQGLPSGGRLSETGQTTLTSQSTIDSGYITNDPEQDTPSTSSYAFTLKQSAQNFYSANNKRLKPSSSVTTAKSPPKDSKTKTWVEQHPVHYTVPQGIMGENYHKSKEGNSHPLKESNSILGAKQPLNESVHLKKEHSLQTPVQCVKTDTDKKNRQQDQKMDTQSVTRSDHTKNPQNHHHRVSDVSVEEVERLQASNPQKQVKGKSVSLSYGLNLIEPLLSHQKSEHLSRSQPKFSGSLLNLVPSDCQMKLKQDRRHHSQIFGSHQNLSGTLPGGWKPGNKGLESGLRMLGKPSLFQLLQSYHLYPVRIQVPENFSVLENVRLIECEVVLPSPWSNKENATVTSPKGSYAKLGGPGSAFKPVVSGNTGIGAVTMVTVVDLSPAIMDKFTSGQINKGDLIVELNEQLMMGEELSTLRSMLQSCHQGELLMTVARDKARDPLHRQNSNSSDTEEARKMEEKISHLKSELRKKDRTLEQLNALLPWKQPGEEEQGGAPNTRDSYICSLSEDEFIV